MERQEQAQKDEIEKTILKFDSGAGGFEYMIITLIVLALIMLIAGGYFLWTWSPPGTGAVY